jgi:hypothetical protein
LASSIGEARPVKVENTCLLKAPVMILFGLPPFVQMPPSTFLRRFSVNGIRLVASVRVPVPSAAAGSAPAVPDEAEFLSVLVLIHEMTDAEGAGNGGRTGVLGLVGADQVEFHVALEFQALEHFLVGKLVVAAGVVDRLRGAGNLRDLVGNLADVAETHGRGRRTGLRVVAFKLRVGRRAASACVCHSWLTAVAFSFSAPLMNGVSVGSIR